MNGRTCFALYNGSLAALNLGFYIIEGYPWSLAAFITSTFLTAWVLTWDE